MEPIPLKGRTNHHELEGDNVDRIGGGGARPMREWGPGR
jgi:hypothetical protein